MQGITPTTATIRDLIRREQERSVEIDSIHAALVAGEESVSNASSLGAKRRA